MYNITSYLAGRVEVGRQSMDTEIQLDTQCRTRLHPCCRSLVRRGQGRSLLQDKPIQRDRPSKLLHCQWSMCHWDRAVECQWKCCCMSTQQDTEYMRWSQLVSMLHEDRVKGGQLAADSRTHWDMDCKHHLAMKEMEKVVYIVKHLLDLHVHSFQSHG